MRFYRHDILATVLAVAVCAMVIAGSLILGDSVNKSLDRVARNSLGQVRTLIRANDSWITTDTVKRYKAGSEVNIEPAIANNAWLSSLQQSRSAAVNLFGVKPGFFKLSSPLKANLPELKPREVILNRELADSLSVKEGDQVSLRYFKPSGMPGDAPFSLNKNGIETVSLKVAAIIEAKQGGDFNPLVAQQVPLNAFIDIDFAARLLGKGERANLLISDADQDILSKLAPLLTLKDYGLKTEKSNEQILLRSESVFLSDYLESVVDGLNKPCNKVFSYFVNKIEHGSKMVPYSFVAGIDQGPIPPETNENEIIINDWLARQLAISAGEKLNLTAFIPEQFGGLSERTDSFVVKEVIPMQGQALDKNLMPRFPGMKNAESCSDWDPSLPVDTSLVRQVDEDYWNEHRGLPKAFIPLATARKLWGNRFGSLTMISFAADTPLNESLLQALNPQAMGYMQQKLYQHKMQAVDKALDFSMLFLGLGFFVIVASLLLMNMLFGFYLEIRHKELAILQTIGFTRRQITFLLMFEALLVSLTGAVAGCLAGVFYAQLKLYLLQTLWQGALNFNSLDLYLNYSSLLIAFFATIIFCMLALYKTLHGFFKNNKAQLLSQENVSKPDGVLWPGFVLLALSLLPLLFINQKDAVTTSAIFFMAGFALLVLVTQAFCRLFIYMARFYKEFTIASLAYKNSLRNFGRSKAVIRVMACALFLVIAVSANQRGALKDPWQKNNGNGGFSIYAETAIPVSGDLNSRKGRYALKLENLGKDISIVQIPKIEGSEASCLNLNPVSRPAILGVKPEQLQKRFSFAWNDSDSNDWNCLNQQLENGVIPAVADAEVIMWSLGLKHGDELALEGSDGKVYRLRFVAGLNNSIFQGRVLVSQKNFYKLWPQTSGSKVLLIDCPPETFSESLQEISRALRRYGAVIEPGAKRLNRFNRVQNTYLSMFLALGAIALLLGCAGLAALLHRNLYERREELKYLRILGFSPKVLNSLLFKEHILLFLSGILSGTLAAALAIYPIVGSAQGALPLKQISILIFVLLATGFLALKIGVKHGSALTQKKL
jgi:ABC-type lipoprotein release transport system permease subunit